MLTLGDILRINTIKYPQKLCVADSNRRYSYDEFNRRVNQLAHGLISIGLEKGDKIAIFAMNSIEYMEVFHATAKIGVCIVTINFRLRMNELLTLFNHSDASAIILDEIYQHDFSEIEEQLVNLSEERVIIIGRPKKPSWRSYHAILENQPNHEPNIATDWEDPYWMLYTSGTTGDPKGAIRSHKRTVLCSWYTLLEFAFTREDHFLAISPFFHGVHYLPLMVMQVGGSVFVVKEFEPEQILKIIDQEGITSTFMVPTMLDTILASPSLLQTNFNQLQAVISGGAALPTKVKLRILEIMGPILYEFYGASESGFLTVLHPRDQNRKTRCCGQPCFGVEIEVRDPDGKALEPGVIGELFTKCAGRFDEYYKNPAKTAEVLISEWFTAGDLGMRDEENFYYIVDRKTDMIISGGENIYPREIEDVLRFHPKVEDCAVIGVSDDLWGEAVKAYIVVKNGEEIEPKEIIEHCAQHLASYKKPKYVEIIDEFPRTSSGKVIKRILKDRELSK